MRGLGHGAVVAVLAGNVEEGGADDVRSVRPHEIDETGEGARAAPFAHGLDARFGEAEIEDAVPGALRKPVETHIQHIRGALHLGGAQGAQILGHLAADVVLPALAAIGADIGQVHPVAEGERGQHGRGLVIRMRAGIHEGGDGSQRLQRAPEGQHQGLGQVTGDAVGLG